MARIIQHEHPGHAVTSSAWSNWDAKSSKCSSPIKPSESSSRTSNNASSSFLTNVSRCPGSAEKPPPQARYASSLWHRAVWKHLGWARALAMQGLVPVAPCIARVRKIGKRWRWQTEETGSTKVAWRMAVIYRSLHNTTSSFETFEQLDRSVFE